MASILEQLFSTQENDEPSLSPDIEAFRLRAALASFQTVHRFTVGQIVRQKTEAKYYKEAGKNDLSIVVAVLETPIRIDGDAGSPEFNGRVDLEIANLTVGGEFPTYHVDRRRYEPVPEDEIALKLSEETA